MRIGYEIDLSQRTGKNYDSIRKSKNILFVDPDFRIITYYIQNDLYMFFGIQWNLKSYQDISHPFNPDQKLNESGM